MTDEEFEAIDEAFKRLATMRREMLAHMEILREILVDATSGVSQKAPPPAGAAGEAKAATSGNRDSSH